MTLILGQPDALSAAIRAAELNVSIERWAAALSELDCCRYRVVGNLGRTTDNTGFQKTLNPRLTLEGSNVRSFFVFGAHRISECLKVTKVADCGQLAFRAKRFSVQRRCRIRWP